MTITLNDEQSRLLSEVVNVGAARSPEEAVDQAVRALHSAATGKRPIHQQVDNLADLFAKSPFRGLNMDFERDKDRDISHRPACDTRTGAALIEALQASPCRELDIEPPRVLLTNVRDVDL